MNRDTSRTVTTRTLTAALLGLSLTASLLGNSATALAGIGNVPERSTWTVGAGPGAKSASVSPIPTTGSKVLDRTLAAHGGVARWRQFGTLSYRLTGFPLTEKTALPSLSTVDLVSRNNRIESAAYTLAFDGTTAWSTPTKDASGLPNRFYSLGSFYFIGMPFVFADGGVIARDGAPIQFRGKTYNTVGISYTSGIGHSDKDDYVLLIDPATDRLAAIHHSVTEAGIERVTWAFDGWQNVGGLLVPSKLTFYPGYKSEPGEGKVTTVSDVNFSRQRPAASLYTPPADAVISQPATK